MDWIFENLQILFFIAAGIAFWLNSLRQAKAEAEAERERDERPVDVDDVFGPDFDFNAPPPPPQQTEVFLPPPVSATPQGAAPPPLPGQAPQPSQRERRDFPQGAPTPQRPQRPQSPHQPAVLTEKANAELERQRNLEQRIRALRQSRDTRGSGAAATQRSVVAARAQRSGALDAEPISIDGIRSRLQSPREARRAIVLREILDTPVGMR